MAKNVSEHSTPTIQKLLLEAFNNTELELFCYDYFPQVYHTFSDSSSFETKTQSLIQYCIQNDSLDQMLTLIQEVNPSKYAEFESSLLNPETEQQSKISLTHDTQQSPLSPRLTPSTNEIFISYSRRDLAFVTQLHQELTRRDISAWFDKENILVGDQWATQIVASIQDCKVFVLVLSPDSAASKNVRKELDLAQRYEKQIVPLMWRNTEIPVAMEYQLAGIQWIDLKETASHENFKALVDVLRRLIGGASLAEATSDKPFAKNPTIPVIPKESISTGPRKLGALKLKSAINPIAVGAAVISSVVITFGLDTEDQDFVNDELKWFFNATDNFLKIRRGEISRSQPIAVPIPAGAQSQPQANNQLLSTVDDFQMQIWEGQIDSGIKRINTHLKNLNILLDQEAKKGEAGKGDVYLQNQIRGARTDILRVLQEIAQLMSQAYGIFITSPNQLLEFLQ